MPAELTLPNVKIQSNFTFSMASTGDPSTFTFTMDAFPGYTYFDPTKKVLCVIQIIEDNVASTEEKKSVMTHTDVESIEESKEDSTPWKTIDMSGVKWPEGLDSVEISLGEAKVELTGVPETLKVTYTGNTATEPGTYTATATFRLAEGVKDTIVPSPMTTTWTAVAGG